MNVPFVSVAHELPTADSLYARQVSAVPVRSMYSEGDLVLSMLPECVVAFGRSDFELYYSGTHSGASDIPRPLSHEAGKVFNGSSKMVSS